MEYGICDEANGDNDNDNVFSPAADHVQVGSSDVQSLEHVHSGLSTPRIAERACSRILRSSAISLLDKPFIGAIGITMP